MPKELQAEFEAISQMPHGVEQARATHAFIDKYDDVVDFDYQQAQLKKVERDRRIADYWQTGKIG